MVAVSWLPNSGTAKRRAMGASPSCSWRLSSSRTCRVRSSSSSTGRLSARCILGRCCQEACSDVRVQCAQCGHAGLGARADDHVGGIVRLIPHQVVVWEQHGGLHPHLHLLPVVGNQLLQQVLQPAEVAVPGAMAHAKHGKLAAERRAHPHAQLLPLLRRQLRAQLHQAAAAHPLVCCVR